MYSHVADLTWLDVIGASTYTIVVSDDLGEEVFIRNDVTYKITGQELIESVIDPLELNPTVTPTAPFTGEVLVVDPNVSGGKSVQKWIYR